MIEIRTDINPKQFFPNAKHIINYAFTVGENHYFQYDDLQSSHYHRPLQALVYYRELDMNCDGAYLDAHIECTDNIASGKDLGLRQWMEVIRLNDQLKQRRQLPPIPDIMYKLASVIFFDQNESPLTYEFKYGEEKIRYWKRSVPLEDFFFQPTLLELMPFLNRYEENTDTFLSQAKTAEKVDRAHLEMMLPFLSEEQKTKLQSSRRSLETE